MGGINFGFNQQSSTSNPVNALTRWMQAQTATNFVNDNVKGLGTTPYQPGEYTSPGAYQTTGDGYTSAGAWIDPGNSERMSDGDYARLEQSILQSRTAPLDRAKSLDSGRIDADLAKRGIWSSGLAQRAQGDNNERYAAGYLQAGGDAAAQRYAMQQHDVDAANAWRMAANQSHNAWNLADAQGLNAYNLNRDNNLNQYNLNAANAANVWNGNVADRQYQAQWMPLNYLSNLYNSQSQGQVSNSSGWGTNFSSGKDK